MCGLFGWSFDHSVEGIDVLATLLAVEAEGRGADSWGFAAVGEKLVTHRSLGAITDSMQPIEWKSFKHFLGHTRFATVGLATIENAHPYRFGDVLGAHNGAVYNHQQLNTSLPEADRLEVDSMHLIKQINFPEDFSKIQGYGAVEWFRCSTPTGAYLAHFNGGQLTILFCKKGAASGFVWASSKRAATKAAAAAGIEVEYEFELKPQEVIFVSGPYVSLENFRMNCSKRTPEYRIYHPQQQEQWAYLHDRNHSKPFFKHVDEEGPLDAKPLKAVRKAGRRVVGDVCEQCSCSYIMFDVEQCLFCGGSTVQYSWDRDIGMPNTLWKGDDVIKSFGEDLEIKKPRSSSVLALAPSNPIRGQGKAA